jgi:hypothetical protein
MKIPININKKNSIRYCIINLYIPSIVPLSVTKVGYGTRRKLTKISNYSICISIIITTKNGNDFFFLL